MNDPAGRRDDAEDMDFTELVQNFNRAVGMTVDDDDEPAGTDTAIQRDATVVTASILKRNRNPFDEEDPADLQPRRRLAPPAEYPPFRSMEAMAAVVQRRAREAGLEDERPARRARVEVSLRRGRDQVQDDDDDDDEDQDPERPMRRARVSLLNRRGREDEPEEARPARRQRVAPPRFRPVAPRGPRDPNAVVQDEQRAQAQRRVREEKELENKDPPAYQQRQSKRVEPNPRIGLNDLLAQYKRQVGHVTRNTFGLIEPWGGLFHHVTADDLKQYNAYGERFLNSFQICADLCGQLETTVMLDRTQDVLRAFFDRHRVNYHNCYKGVELYRDGIDAASFCVPSQSQNGSLVSHPILNIFNSSLLDGICAILGPMPIDRDNPPRAPGNMDFLIRAYLRHEKPFYVFRFIWLRLLEFERDACREPIRQFMYEYQTRNVLDDRSSVLRRCVLLIDGGLEDFVMDGWERGPRP